MIIFRSSEVKSSISTSSYTSNFRTSFRLSLLSVPIPRWVLLFELHRALVRVESERSESVRCKVPVVSIRHVQCIVGRRYRSFESSSIHLPASVRRIHLRRIFVLRWFRCRQGLVYVSSDDQIRLSTNQRLMSVHDGVVQHIRVRPVVHPARHVRTHLVSSTERRESKSDWSHWLQIVALFRDSIVLILLESVVLFGFETTCYHPQPNAHSKSCIVQSRCLSWIVWRVSVVCFVSHSSAAQHPVRASVTTKTASCRLSSKRKPKSSCKQSRRSGCFVWYDCRAFAATQVLHHARNGKCVNSCSSRSCWLGCRGIGRPRATCVSRSCSGSSGVVSWNSSDASRSSFRLENSVILVYFRVSFSNSSSPLVQSSWCSMIDPSENCIMVLRPRTSVSGGLCSFGRCSAPGRKSRDRGLTCVVSIFHRRFPSSRVRVSVSIWVESMVFLVSRDQ